MSGRIAILSSGLWRLRSDVEALTGMTPVFALPGCLPTRSAAVAGWGHKPTAHSARRLASQHELPYVAFEDGFLRSVRSGPFEVTQSLIVDRAGIYYDARTPCDLEQMLNRKGTLGAHENRLARSAMNILRDNRLSKYNDAPPSDIGGNVAALRGRGARVLVIDQTRGDASIAGAHANEATFAQMLDAAIAENPKQQIAVKLHPETLVGRKHGYLGDLARKAGAEVISAKVNPWALFENFDLVYTVSSQLGFEALMAGCRVVCFGLPFYAGWGLTDDRISSPRRVNKLTLNQLVHAVYFKYSRYLCAWTRKELDFFAAAEQLMFRRDHFHSNDAKTTCLGISAWKRPVVRKMLSGSAGEPTFQRFPSRSAGAARLNGARVAIWGSRLINAASKKLDGDIAVTCIEDGFLRSIGLGAGFTKPLSLVFDRTGIYYDPRSPSDLETLLQTARFSERELKRARKLRRLIVDAQLTKYNLKAQYDALRTPVGRPVILVPGQVANDQSILLGAKCLCNKEPLSSGGANLALLRSVRQRNKDAFIIYKPHPDVEAGLRAGKIDPRIAGSIADLVYEKGSITALYDKITSVETATSLTGFEALLRGLPVVTHGQPFYAGWGLTIDLNPCIRRTMTRTLDELVAACLLRYAVYVFPGTNEVCPAEIAAQALVNARKVPETIVSRVHFALKKSFAKLRYNTINLFNV